LVEPRDIDGLAKKLETLLNDDQLRKELGLWSLAEREKYSWETVDRKIEKILCPGVAKQSRSIEIQVLDAVERSYFLEA
jgi:glycosyltransferase involved in cell wall biosynthesis